MCFRCFWHPAGVAVILLVPPISSLLILLEYLSGAVCMPCARFLCCRLPHRVVHLWSASYVTGCCLSHLRLCTARRHPWLSTTATRSPDISVLPDISARTCGAFADCWLAFFHSAVCYGISTPVMSTSVAGFSQFLGAVGFFAVSCLC